MSAEVLREETLAPSDNTTEVTDCNREQRKARGELAVVLKGVRKAFVNGLVEQEVLSGIDLDIGEGEFLAILGASGSGKTTLLNIIGAMDTPTAGSVTIFGSDIARMSEVERTRFRRESLGFVFQFYNLLPTFTALENIRIGIELLRISGAEVEERARYYLNAVGLADKADRFPGQLSGGEQQRVAIARALAKKPRLLIADEPTGNLDRATARAILGLMRQLQRDSGTTFIIVTHDLDVTNFTDRTYRLV